MLSAEVDRTDGLGLCDRNRALVGLSSIFGTFSPVVLSSAATIRVTVICTGGDWEVVVLFALLSIEKRLGKRVVADFQRGDLLVLISGDSNESRHWEWLGLDEFLGTSCTADFDDVNSRLVFVQRVEHDLLAVVLIKFVGQFYF